MKNLKQAIVFMVVVTNSILLCSSSSLSSPSREEKLQKLLSRYETESKDLELNPHAEYKNSILNDTNSLVEYFNQEHDVTKKIEIMEGVIRILVLVNLSHYLTRSLEASDKRRIIAIMHGADIYRKEIQKEAIFKKNLDLKLFALKLKLKENAPLSDDDIAELDTRRNFIKFEEQQIINIHLKVIVHLMGTGMLLGAILTSSIIYLWSNKQS